jgi:hypothetical protein
METQTGTSDTESENRRMRMKGRHTITAKELDEWLSMPQWETFARSFSDRSHKALELDATAPDIVFRVTDHGETTFIGTDKAAAIAAYNAAQ